MPSENFIDNGQAWDGTTQYIVAPGQFIQASASVSPLASNLSIYVDTNGTCSGFFTFYCEVNQVIMTIGTYKKILSNITDYCFGGCGNPFCPGNPPPISYNLTQQEVSMAKSAGSIILSISVCGGAMVLRPVAVLEQTLTTPSGQPLTGTATITVITPDGAPASNATVVLTDTTTGVQIASEATNSSGIAEFSNLNIGDSFKATVSYDGFAQSSASFSLEQSSYSFTVQLQCPAGSTYANGKCVQAPTVAGQVITGLEIVAVIVGIAGAAFIISEVIPKRSIIEERVRSGVKSAGEAIRENINKLRGAS